MRHLWILLPALGLGACATAPQPPATAVVTPSAPSAPVGVASAAALTMPAASASPQRQDMASDSIWRELPRGFSLSQLDRPEIDYWLEFYSQRPRMVGAIFERAKPFLYEVSQTVSERNLPLELALLPAIESGFQPTAYSRSHASGLWQFIPMTAGRFGLHADDWLDKRRDVRSSTKAALDYLSYLNKFFDGDWYLAIAAYNAGEGRVRSAVRKNQAAGRPTDFWSLDLPKETRDYVPRLMAMARLVARPDLAGISLPHIPSHPVVATVPIRESLDLGVAARLLEMPVDSLKQLNPGLKQFATPPNREYKLTVPNEKLSDFQVALAQLTPADKTPWERHVVKPGERLTDVAQKYGVDLAQLKRQNPGLSAPKAGATLLVQQGPVRYPSSFLAATPAVAAPARTQVADSGFLSRWLHGDTPKKEKPSLMVAAQKPKAFGKAREVVVKTGETLYRIARNANVPLEDLRRWNRLAPDEPVRAGQRLVLADTAFGPPLAQASRQFTYVAQLGDTLWSVARRFNVSFHELIDWNRLASTHELRAGERLLVRQ